jgi:hypothetical protein
MTGMRVCGSRSYANTVHRDGDPVGAQLPDTPSKTRELLARQFNLTT